MQKKTSGGLPPLYFDVTIPKSSASAQEKIVVAVGSTGLSGLINNARGFLGGPLEFLALDDLHKQLEVNLIGAITVAHALLARRPKARYLVGQDARARAIIRYLPVGIRDWLITRLSGSLKKLT